MVEERRDFMVSNVHAFLHPLHLGRQDGEFVGEFRKDVRFRVGFRVIVFGLSGSHSDRVCVEGYWGVVGG